MGVQSGTTDTIRNLVILLSSAREEGEKVHSVMERHLKDLEISPGKNKNISLLMKARILYETSPWLQRIPDKVIHDPYSLVKYFRREKKPKKLKDQPLSSLVQALYAGERMTNGECKRMALDIGALENYENNPLLQVIPKRVLNDNVQTIIYLQKNRPYMELEEDKTSLGYLVHSLEMGKKINGKEATRLRFCAGAADYALTNKEMITGEIERAYSKLNKIQRENLKINELRKKVNKSKFLKRDGKDHIGRKYFEEVFKFAMISYGNDLVDYLRNKEQKQKHL